MKSIDWLINQVDESYVSFIGKETLMRSSENGDEVASLIIEKLEDLDEISTGRELVWGAITTLKNIERSIQSILVGLYDMQEDVVQDELLEGAPYIESDAEYEKRVDKIQEDLLSVRDFDD